MWRGDKVPTLSERQTETGRRSPGPKWNLCSRSLSSPPHFFLAFPFPSLCPLVLIEVHILLYSDTEGELLEARALKGQRS